MSSRYYLGGAAIPGKGQYCQVPGSSQILGQPKPDFFQTSFILLYSFSALQPHLCHVNKSLSVFQPQMFTSTTKPHNLASLSIQLKGKGQNAGPNTHM